jgi:hypothetical protein
MDKTLSSIRLNHHTISISQRSTRIINDVPKGLLLLWVSFPALLLFAVGLFLFSLQNIVGSHLNVPTAGTQSVSWDFNPYVLQRPSTASFSCEIQRI